MLSIYTEIDHPARDRLYPSKHSPFAQYGKPSFISTDRDIPSNTYVQFLNIYLPETTANNILSARRKNELRADLKLNLFNKG